MNKRKLQEFATWSKQNLEKQIEISLKKIGIHSSTSINQSRVRGDITVIDGIEETFDKNFQRTREEIINKIKSDGYSHSIEQFASTWFNRIVALRFMEVHDYLDHGFKIFPKEQNTLPDILSKLSLVENELNLDMDYCQELLSSGNKHEELYRYVLFQQSNALAKPLPMLFSSGMEYLEYFIPTPLLFGDTIINRLIEIDENDFKEEVEIIGWLYQFYIASKKDEVFASKKTITKDTLPAVTQLFTPDWIVRYMAENSVGRIWLESYPESSLKTKMKYFVEEAKQEPEVIEQLEAIKYKNVNPEDIKIIEPASGSGHILVYVFELLYEMYIEKGYLKKNIPQLIFKNNLFGLDIDQRATQLASFALAMKARSIDNRFFDEGRYVRPRVYEIIDSKPLLGNQYNGKTYLEILNSYNDEQWKGENELSDNELKVIKYIVELFEEGKVIGSLLKVRPYKYLSLRKKLATNIIKHTQTDIFTSAFFDNEFKILLELLRIAHILSSQYDVMITNPPYIGISSLEKEAKAYLVKNYPESKTDMFAMFMELDLIKEDGFISMINMHSWMFLDSFTDLRRKILKNNIVSLVHLGIKAFETIGNDVVQTCAFILKISKIMNFKSIYIGLSDVKDYNQKQKEFFNENLRFYHKNETFLLSNTVAMCYWVENSFFTNYKTGLSINEFSTVSGAKNVTGNNEKYIRFFWEIESNKISKFYWVLCTKGGFYRKYYGNIIHVLDWRESAKEFYRNNKTSSILPEKEWYKPGITYSAVTSRGTGFRYAPKDHLSDSAGPIINFSEELIPYFLAFYNSKVADYYFKAINPSINLTKNDLKSIPYIVENKGEIEALSNNQIDMSKIDWNSQETSFEFKANELIKGQKIRENYYELVETYELLRKKYIENEKIINNTFKKIYNLNSINIDLENRDISIRKIDKLSEIYKLISYLIGVLMGRYSLLEEGLIFAGGEFDELRYGNYDVDEDGIIPIFTDISIENGLVHRIIGLIKGIYGVDHYRENIEFIADALGKKSNETSEETLNRYLNDDFYSEHIKTYQKRPIYWMFSSGKKQGFKALIYMHRYNSNTLAKMNASYFQPATTVLRTKISEIEKQISGASERDKVQLERTRFSLVEQLNEAIEYGQVLDYMANKYISIDLDDGVKVNYEKFQKVEINTSNGKVKKDLLIPIK